LDQQTERVWRQLQSMPTELARNLLLDQLHYRHEVLYFKVFSQHLTEVMPSAPANTPRFSASAAIAAELVALRCVSLKDQLGQPDLKSGVRPGW